MKKSKVKPTPSKPIEAGTEASVYTPPVDRLLALGDSRETIRKWPDYKGLGLASEHVPELTRMAADESLIWSVSESDEVWAPIHAWRALGQLQAVEAVPGLLGLFKDIEDNDWIGEELPRAFALIGPPAIEPTSKYLLDTKNEMWARVNAAGCLEQIALRHRAARELCIGSLSRALEEFAGNDPTLNASIIASLCELEADEALPLIEGAFKAEVVDEWVMGDWDDVRARFGLPPERIDEQALKDAAQGLKSPPPRQMFFSRYLQQSPPPRRSDR